MCPTCAETEHRFDGDSFTTSFNLSDSLSGGYPLARIGGVAVDGKNKVHVVWSDGRTGVFEVYHSIYNGTSWSESENISRNPVGTSGMPEIAIDSNDCLHVIWHDYGSSGACDIYYSCKYEDQDWSVPVNISNLVGQSWDQQIAVSQEGYPHVVWSEESRHIYYSFFDGGSWSTPYRLNDLIGQDEGYMPDLVVDIEGNVHIVWTEDGGDLYYTFYNGIVWSSPLNVSGSPQTSGAAEIVVDKSQSLHLVWSEAASEIYYSNHLVICGDCNGDEFVNFADALYLKNYYYQTPPGSPAPLGFGDVNVDGKITFADALYLKNCYYQTPPGSPPPCQPFGLSKSDEQATVSFSSPRTANGIVEIPVRAQFGVPSEGVGLEVTYDHTVLKPLMPELTSRTGDLDLCCNPTLENGRLLLGVLCLTTNELIQPGDGAVVMLRFESVGPDVDLSSLRIEEAIVVDERARELKTTVLGYPLVLSLPKVFSLSQNYPNPFWNETLIRYALPGNGVKKKVHVVLKVYDSAGRLVKTIVNEDKEAGYHTVHWNCTDKSGDRVAAGVYFYRLEAGDFRSTKKMVLVH